MRRKAQIHMGESIAVIIIIIVLITFGFVFYGKVKSSSIGEQKVLFEELDAVKLSQVVYALPEIQCSFAGGADYGCVDLLKFISLSNIINESHYGHDQTNYFYYREIFGKARISIDRMNAAGFTDNLELYVGNNTWTSKSTIYMPIVLYNPIDDSNDFGVLTIEKFH